MNTDEYIESEISDTGSIKKFITNIKNQNSELILTCESETVGAILTREQYDWFLDQLDSYQDTGFIEERVKDKDGVQDLVDFKRELE